MIAYLDVLEKYAVFSGRARRSEYWGFFLINVVVALVIAGVNVVIDRGSAHSYGLLSWVYNLAVLVPTVAVFVRRLHDTGHSAWWLFIGIVPVVGIIVLLVWLVTDSQPGPNKYGPYPKSVGHKPVS